MSLTYETPRPRNRVSTLALGFVGGAGSVLLLQLANGLVSSSPSSTTYSRVSNIWRRHADMYPRQAVEGAFPGDIGSTLVHQYPPASPTNNDAGLFPTQVGFAGSTKTGAEAAVVMTATAYPTSPGTAGLVTPDTWTQGANDNPSWIDNSGSSGSQSFSIFQNWGNLSPFYSVKGDAFGLSNTSPEVPSGCELTGVHILHRHGSRYPSGPTGYAAPAALAARFHNVTGSIQGHGALSFINDWTYKLGEAVLNHFGRQQMFDLGVSMRMKYGTLLESFTDKLPVFRTESQDRMLASETNFAFGFFGWPLDNKFLLSVTIEQTGFNNTLAPYTTCTNDNDPTKGDRGTAYQKQWISVYLADAKTRLQGLLSGYTLTFEDVFSMQLMCAYESTALGYSAFCPLFTKAEWEGFEYAWDLYFWYDVGPGSPVARAQGTGYVLELLSRLTQTPITSTSGPTSNPSVFSVNTTLDSNPTTFPLNNNLYSDATHEVVMMNIYTALNLTALGQESLSATKMKRNRKWVTSRFAPFGSNMQIQLLTCPNLGNSSPTSTHTTSTRHSGSTTASATSTATTSASTPNSSQIRIVINDAVVALTGIQGCPNQKDGLCPLNTFIASQKKLVENTDWDWACYGNWTVPAGDAWQTVTGDPPAKPHN